MIFLTALRKRVSSTSHHETGSPSKKRRPAQNSERVNLSQFTIYKDYLKNRKSRTDWSVFPDDCFKKLDYVQRFLRNEIPIWGKTFLQWGAVLTPRLRQAPKVFEDQSATHNQFDRKLRCFMSAMKYLSEKHPQDPRVMELNNLLTSNDETLRQTLQFELIWPQFCVGVVILAKELKQNPTSSSSASASASDKNGSSCAGPDSDSTSASAKAAPPLTSKQALGLRSVDEFDFTREVAFPNNHVAKMYLRAREYRDPDNIPYYSIVAKAEATFPAQASCEVRMGFKLDEFGFLQLTKNPKWVLKHEGFMPEEFFQPVDYSVWLFETLFGAEFPQKAGISLRNFIRNRNP